MIFLFPADPFNPKKIDPMFDDQAQALTTAGHRCLTDKGSEILNGEQVMYRGWMLTPNEYSNLRIQVGKRNGRMPTNLIQYVMCHELPYWYPLIVDHTAESRWFPADEDDKAAKLVEQWGGGFIKDFVKSNKAALGSIARSAEETHAILAELRKYRGKLEGGICVRRLEVLTDEQRFFVLKGQVCAPPEAGALHEDLACRIASRLPSPFFSVDVALNDVGQPRVVEIGDGQVSDLVGTWTPQAFAAIWSH